MFIFYILDYLKLNNMRSTKLNPNTLASEKIIFRSICKWSDPFLGDTNNHLLIHPLFLLPISINILLNYVCWFFFPSSKCWQFTINIKWTVGKLKHSVIHGWYKIFNGKYMHIYDTYISRVWRESDPKLCTHWTARTIILNF